MIKKFIVLIGLGVMLASCGSEVAPEDHSTFVMIDDLKEKISPGETTRAEFEAIFGEYCMWFVNEDADIPPEHLYRIDAAKSCVYADPNMSNLEETVISAPLTIIYQENASNQEVVQIAELRTYLFDELLLKTFLVVYGEPDAVFESFCDGVWLCDFDLIYLDKGVAATIIQSGSGKSEDGIEVDAEVRLITLFEPMSLEEYFNRPRDRGKPQDQKEEILVEWDDIWQGE